MSRQTWKLHVLVAGFGLGGISAFFDVFIVKLKGAFSPLPLLVGLVVAWVSAAFACLSIRCPSCATRWLWRAVNSSGSIGGGWLVQLMSGNHCPECGWPHEEHEEEESGEGIP